MSTLTFYEEAIQQVDWSAWYTDYEAALQAALRERKPVFLQFDREGCQGCARLYTTTYQEPEVLDELYAWFIPLKQHIIRNRKVRATYAAVWTPSMYFLDARGKAYHSVAGYLPPEDFRMVLRLGSAQVFIPRGRYREAIERLEDGYERWPENPWAPALFYWRIIAEYLLNWDQVRMHEQFVALRTRWPESREARMWPYPESE